MTKGDGYLLTKKSRVYQSYDPSRFYERQPYIGQDEVFDAKVLDDHIFVSMSGEQYQLALKRDLPTDGSYPALSGYFTDQATVSAVMTGQNTFDAVALGDKLQQNPHLDAMTGEYLYNDHLACLTIDRDALLQNYQTADFRAAVGKCLANDNLGRGGGNQGFNDLLNEMVNNGTLKVDPGRSLICPDSRCSEERLARMQNNTLMRDADCRAQLLESGTVEEPRAEVCRNSSFGPPLEPVGEPPFSNENWYNQSRTPVQEMGSYLSAHKYSRMDYPTYSQNPTWQTLNDEILKSEGQALLHPEAPKTAPVLERPALERMSAYMSSHNYGKMDYPTYSQDPEWQRLNEALKAEDGRRTLGQLTSPPVQTEKTGAAESQAVAPAVTQVGQVSAQKGMPENTVTVDARSVDLSGAMGMESENFWNHHGNTKEDYQKLASHLPEVQKGLAEGRTLEEMRNDPALRDTVIAYYDPDKMVKVEAKEGGGYNYIDDGRHRVLAAQEQGCSIPVQVVNGEQQDKTKDETIGVQPKTEGNEKEVPRQETTSVEPKTENTEKQLFNQEPTSVQPKTEGSGESQNPQNTQANIQEAGITEPKSQQSGRNNAQEAGNTEPKGPQNTQSSVQDAGNTEPKGPQNTQSSVQDAGNTEPKGPQNTRSSVQDAGITESKNQQNDKDNGKDNGIRDTTPGQSTDQTNAKDNGIRDNPNQTNDRQSGGSDHSQDKGIQR